MSDIKTYRISLEKYSNDLNASGSQRRWNLDKQYVIYSGSSRSLATLEVIVYRKNIQPDVNYKVMVISFPDDEDLQTKISENDLPEDWRSPEAYSELQKIGSNWYRKLKSLILKVPSAVIPQEYNYVINTSHEDFKKKIKLVRTEEYFWDKRLL